MHSSISFLVAAFAASALAVPLTNTSTTSYACGYGTNADGSCAAPTSTTSSVSTTSTSSVYCGFGTALNGNCNPPPSTTTSASSTTTHYCGFGTAANGSCNPPTSTTTSTSSTTTHECGFGTALNGSCNPPTSTTTSTSSTTTHYCEFGTAANGSCNAPTSTTTSSSSTTTSVSHYCGFGTALNGNCNPPPTSTSTSTTTTSHRSSSTTSSVSSTTTKPTSKSTTVSSTTTPVSHYCGFGTASNGQCNSAPPTSTSTSSSPSSTSVSHYCGYGTAANGQCLPPKPTTTPNGCPTALTVTETITATPTLAPHMFYGLSECVGCQTITITMAIPTSVGACDEPHAPLAGFRQNPRPPQPSTPSDDVYEKDMHKARAVTPRPDPSAGLAATTRPARRASKSFQFVTANPSSDAERSHNKVLVRSNASNYHWKRFKKDVDDSSSQPVASRRSSNHGHLKSSKRTIASATPQTAGSTTESEGPTPKSKEEPIEPITESPILVGELATHFPDSLSTLVVSSHHDPFETYPCELPKEFVSPVLDQVNSFLSLMFPPGKGQTISPYSEKWLQMTFRDRTLFHASMFCQLTRNRVFVASPAQSPEQMQCYTETIRGVHQKFADTLLRCEDENILAVYALSHHGELRRHPPVVSPSQGPLTTLQHLHLYGGRLHIVNVHLQGLAKMLALRGGLSKIKLPGLAQAISFGDIILACQTLTRPMLPYEQMGADVIGPLNAASRKNHPLVGLGRGFRVLPELLGHEIVEELLIVLKWMIQYTFAVDDRVNNRPEAQRLGCLADERNFVQHNLMLLSPLSPGVQDEHPLIRLSRLGTVVYSLLVVFPLPAVAAPFHRLACDIKTQLLDPTIQAWWTEASDLILWATVMGAVAAIGHPERQWYLTILDELTRQLGVDSWPSMREWLNMFLWYGYTNDSDGLKLWREIEESNLFRVPK